MSKKKCYENRPGAIFATIHFFRNLQMNPISLSVTLHKIGKATKGQTLLLTAPLHKLQRKSVIITALGPYLPQFIFL